MSKLDKAIGVVMILSVTDMVILASVPKLSLVGVPLNSPVVALKSAQLGLFIML